MSNPFEIYKAIYNKTPLPEFNYDVGTCLILSKWIGKDPQEIGKVKRILPFIFYIEPKHYIYLLYASITRKRPYFEKKKTETSEKENKVLIRIKELLNWSDREFKFNKPILEKVVDEKYWKLELGIK